MYIFCEGVNYREIAHTQTPAPLRRTTTAHSRWGLHQEHNRGGAAQGARAARGRYAYTFQPARTVITVRSREIQQRIDFGISLPMRLQFCGAVQLCVCHAYANSGPLLSLARPHPHNSPTRMHMHSCVLPSCSCFWQITPFLGFTRQAWTSPVSSDCPRWRDLPRCSAPFLILGVPLVPLAHSGTCVCVCQMQI